MPYLVLSIIIQLALVIHILKTGRAVTWLFQKVINESRIAGRHYNSIHREWVEMARREA
jgi:hypothetical protein